jgi:hypothetical protein
MDSTMDPLRAKSHLACRLSAVIIGALLPAFVLLADLRANGSEAIPFYQVYSPNIFGFARGGAGLAFSPLNDLVITAIGCGDELVSNETSQVTLWDTNGAVLASRLVTTNSPFFNSTFYETITPLPLTRGQTYYLSEAALSDGVWVGNVICMSQSAPSGTFSIAPQIDYLASAFNTNSDGSFPALLDTNACLAVGANFLFLRAPLIQASGLLVRNNQVQVPFNVIGNSAGTFTLLHADQPGGPWSTNLNATLQTNQFGSSYTFTTTGDSSARFFRVQCP